MHEARAGRGLHFLLGCAGFASMVSMRVCDPLVALFAADFAVALGAAAWTVFGFALSYGAMQLFYGPLGDRYGKLRVLSGAVAAGALCNALIACSPNFEAVVAGRLLAGAAGAGIVPLALAWIGDTVPYQQRQAVLNRYFFATILGMSVGQWCAGLLAEAGGWRLVFAVVSLLFCVIAWALRRACRGLARQGAPAPPAAAGTLAAQLGVVLRVPRARCVLLTAMAEGVFVLGAFALVPAYLQQRFALTVAASGAIVALYGLGGLAFAAVGTRLGRRLGEGRQALAGAACLGLAMALLAAGSAWWCSVPACLLGGFGFYMLHSAVQLNATQMVPGLRGTAVAAFVAALFLGQSAGVAAASLALQAGHVGAMFGGCALVLPVLGWWFGKGIGPMKGGAA